MKKFIALFLSLVIFAACDIRGTVAFFGDSNAVASAHMYITVLFRDPNGISIVPMFPSAGGAGFVHHAEFASALSQFESDAYVSQLGLNDCIVGPGGTSYQSQSQYAAWIDEVYNTIPLDKPLIIIDAPYVPHINYVTSCLVQVNLALQAAYWRQVALGRQVVYINVNDILNALSPNDRYVDGVHYNTVAQERIALAVRAHLLNLL